MKNINVVLFVVVAATNNTNESANESYVRKYNVLCDETGIPILNESGFPLILNSVRFYKSNGVSKTGKSFTGIKEGHFEIPAEFCNTLDTVTVSKNTAILAICQKSAENKMKPSDSLKYESEKMEKNIAKVVENKTATLNKNGGDFEAAMQLLIENSIDKRKFRNPDKLKEGMAVLPKDTVVKFIHLMPKVEGKRPTEVFCDLYREYLKPTSDLNKSEKDFNPFDSL